MRYHNANEANGRRAALSAPSWHQAHRRASSYRLLQNESSSATYKPWSACVGAGQRHLAVIGIGRMMMTKNLRSTICHGLVAYVRPGQAPACNPSDWMASIHGQRGTAVTSTASGLHSIQTRETAAINIATECADAAEVNVQAPVAHAVGLVLARTCARVLIEAQGPVHAVASKPT